MEYEEMMKNLNSFTGKLLDKESKELFSARFHYMIDRNKELFYKRLDEILKERERKYSSWGLNLYAGEYPDMVDKKFVIFGWGEMGRLTYRTLHYLNKEIECVCDNNCLLQGRKIDEHTEIHNFEYVKQNCKDCVIIVAVSKQYQLEIFYSLKNAGFKDRNILMYPEGGLYCDILNQYFDLEYLTPDMGNEIFLDAGCYDGATSAQSYKWGKCKKIYAFEPDGNNVSICRSRLDTIGCDYELFNLATWSKKEKLSFNSVQGQEYASRVSNSGAICVDADSIDNVLDERPVTYIKLDVEGSELETLYGAVRTIKKWHPNMAISIYHKPEDIVEIPMFLEALNMNYSYCIRQYQTRMQETVLYALYKED